MRQLETTTGRAGMSLPASAALTAPSSPSTEREGSAITGLSADASMSSPPVPLETIGAIRLSYRAAKSAEAARIAIDQKLVSYVRVHITDWMPGAPEVERTRANTQARRVVKVVSDVVDRIKKTKLAAMPKGTTAPVEISGEEVREALVQTASPDDVDLCLTILVLAAPSLVIRSEFDKEVDLRRKVVKKIVKKLPAWEHLKAIRGLSEWGLTAIIGEAGDIGAYPGCRHLYKRLGLAPNEAYEKGEKSTGRKIPRMARGRVMGIIADPLLRAQWRGPTEEGGVGHAIGPYGKVYGETKARHLEAGRTKGHAHNLARRAMLKALLHDVHAAWHGRPLDYV